jgi:copper chaperone CopZ
VTIQTTYQIPGLTRWSDADAIAGQLNGLPGVEDVRMDIVAGHAAVTSDRELPHAEVGRAISAAGFALSTVEPERRGEFRAGIAVFVCGLAVALVAGYTLAQLTAPAAEAEAMPDASAAMAGAHKHGRAENTGGLSSVSSGFRLVPEETAFEKGTRELSFVVRDGQGKAVTAFATVHEKPLHLIVLRRDLTGYQHLHPVMAPDGRWKVTADLAEPGSWQAYADFTVINASFAQIPLTLGFGLQVGGDFQPRPLPPAAREARTATHTVSFSGEPVSGQAVLLPFNVFAGGERVALEPYLGSFGHLVVVRQGDLAYLHVHPEPLLANGSVQFWITAEPGTYRLFFDYQTGGKVQTAEFSLVVA